MDVKRYEMEYTPHCPSQLVESDDGEYVLYSDHLAALAESERKVRELENIVGRLSAQLAHLQSRLEPVEEVYEKHKNQMFGLPDWNWGFKSDTERAFWQAIKSCSEPTDNKR